LCIVSPPGLDLTFEIEEQGATITYSLDEMLLLFQFCRVYLWFRIFAHFSFWTTYKAAKFCDNYSAKANSFFAIKAYMKSQPYMIVFFLLSSSVMVFGLMFRIVERPYPSDDFEPIWNGWWLIMVTMTTIGYGEIYPVTSLGRLIAAIACIWGIFLISSFVVALTNKVEIAGDEITIYNKLVERIYIRKRLRFIAAKLI
jgi:hypothetical protein